MAFCLTLREKLSSCFSCLIVDGVREDEVDEAIVEAIEVEEGEAAGEDEDVLEALGAFQFLWNALTRTRLARG